MFALARASQQSVDCRLPGGRFLARVFLSYSRQDLSVAEKLAADLGRHGHEVWWDRHLHGGARFASEIEAALANADAVVVLWSEPSLKSAWVQDEAAEGRDSGRLVPVLLDDCRPPLGFRQFHAIDYRKREGQAGEAGLAAIHAALSGDRTALPPVVPVAADRRPAENPRNWIAGFGLASAGVAAAVIWQSLENVGDAPARLQLAEFTALSPDIPASAPAAVREEILSAIGTDGRIIIAENGENGTSGYVASGSIRKAGETLRFTIHLSDPRQSKNLWTTTFERPFKEIDVAPRQVAAAASLVLRCGLTGQAQHAGGIQDEALALYLNYCAEFWAETGGRTMSARRGLDFARRVVELEPGFARGWSARARMASWAMREATGNPASAFRREADGAARKALSLDPRNSQAYEVLAHLQPRNSVARERLHARSVSVQPGDCGCEHVGFGGFLGGVGRMTESLDQYQRAKDMVPLSVSVNASLAEGLFAAGRNDEASRLVAPILEVWPDDRQMHDMLVRTAFWTGRTQEALRSLARPSAHFTTAERTAYAAALRAVAAKQRPRSTIEGLNALASEPGARRALLVTALAALGADRDGLAVASQMFGSSGSPEQFVLFEPALAGARRTSEFADLASRIGLVRYWRESRKLPEFCAAKSPPLLCQELR